MNPKSSFRLWKYRGLAAAIVLCATARAQEIWKLDNTEKIAGHPVVVEGSPRITEVDGAKAMTFDGAKDGIFLSTIPIAGARQFTIEILFEPTEGGPEAQRFVHIEDARGARAMIETRLDGKGNWWIDTFLLGGASSRGVALIDPKHTHPTNRWYWAALRYDGTTMSHYVNGEKEMSAPIALEPFGDGKISLGVRQNKVFWFKGAIREVRFHREAISETKLQRVK